MGNCVQKAEYFKQDLEELERQKKPGEGLDSQQELEHQQPEQELEEPERQKKPERTGLSKRDERVLNDRWARHTADRENFRRIKQKRKFHTTEGVIDQDGKVNGIKVADCITVTAPRDVRPTREELEKHHKSLEEHHNKTEPLPDHYKIDTGIGKLLKELKKELHPADHKAFDDALAAYDRSDEDLYDLRECVRRILRLIFLNQPKKQFIELGQEHKNLYKAFHELYQNFGDELDSGVLTDRLNQILKGNVDSSEPTEDNATTVRRLAEDNLQTGDILGAQFLFLASFGVFYMLQRRFQWFTTKLE